MELSTIIKATGLTDREAEIYLALLEFHAAPASKIASRIGQKRTTVYQSLQNLCQQGIVSLALKNKVQRFSAISPNDLYERMLRSTENLKKQLPQLYALYEKYEHQTKVHFYEGLEGAKQAYLDKLYHGEKIQCFLGMSGIHPGLKEFMYEEYLHKKLSLGIHSRVIVSDTPLNREFIARDTQEARDSLLINSPLLQLDCEIDMYGDNRVCVIMGTNQTVSAIIIENQSIHNALQSFFNLLRQQYGCDVKE